MGNEHNINREQNMLAVLQAEPTEANLWDAVCLFQRTVFKTYSGLEFTYELRRGRSGVTYIYALFYRFGLIDVPDQVKEKMDLASVEFLI